MPKRQSSCPERDIRAQRQNVREKDTRFQTRESVSDCIQNAILVFEKLLEDYWAMQAELDMKFNEVFASSHANMTDFILIINLQIRTTSASMEIVSALERLARLLHFVE